MGRNGLEIYPGADDNASGVAVVLELAHRLRAWHAQGLLTGSKNILFAIWSGEELGVLGSSHFVNIALHGKEKLQSIDAVINFDMVGRLKNTLMVQGIGSSPDWSPHLKYAQSHTSLKLLLQEDPYLPTDSTPFYIRGVPTLSFFSGAHDDYHTPEDTPDKLNYVGMQKISDVTCELILRLIQTSKPLAYHSIAKKHIANSTSFKVYLGTIPDYATQNIHGVRLSGVIKNSPAEKYGLKAGDIIIRAANRAIKDIYDYTDALNKLEPNERFQLTIERANKYHSLFIVADAR